MNELFTDRARKVMQLANQEAQKHYHEYIGTEHILLGLVRESTTSAPNAVTTLLAAMGVDIYKIPGEIEKLIQAGPNMVTIGKLPQTPMAKRVVELAMEFAKARNEAVDLEHFLVGMMKERDGVAGQVLANLGATYEKALGIIPAPPVPRAVHGSTVGSSHDWTCVVGADVAGGSGTVIGFHDCGPVNQPAPRPACETCRFFKETYRYEGEPPIGNCLRRSPESKYNWPTVNAAWWCGEYEQQTN